MCSPRMTSLKRLGSEQLVRTCSVETQHAQPSNNTICTSLATGRETYLGFLQFLHKYNYISNIFGTMAHGLLMCPYAYSIHVSTEILV